MRTISGALTFWCFITAIGCLRAIVVAGPSASPLMLGVFVGGFVFCVVFGNYWLMRLLEEIR